MRMTRIGAWALTGLCAACLPERPAGRRVEDRAARGTPKTVPGLLAVDWKDGTTRDQFNAEEGRFGIDVELASPWGEPFGLTVAKGVQITEDLLAKLRADPLVERAEPVYQYDALFVPDDPQYKLQWHMKQIGSETAWNWGSGEDVVVAVVDTGVSRLPDLAATKFVPGWDFVHGRADATDDHGHGSHVAGTVAQSTDNGTGVAGLAHRAAIMPLKVLDSSGAGKTTDIADAIRFATDHGAKVLNLSLGGAGYSGILADAVKYARSRGVFVACAAGNGFGPPVGYPAAYDGAFAVSAVRYDRALAPYSSFGPEVDIAAPGGDTSVDQNGDGAPDGVLQQTIGGEYKWFQGTSMATPHVAGAAALLAGAGVTRVEAIERILRSTAVELKDRERFGAGEVDAAAALKHVRLTGSLGRVVLAVLLAWVAWRLVRRREGRPVPLGWGMAAALLLASAGLFVLPLVGLGHPSGAALLSAPLPEWGRVLHGSRISSPLWLSAFLPFLMLGLSRARALAGVAAGLCLGWAAYMLHAAGTGWVDLAWIPGRTVEALWLAGNAFVSFVLGMIAMRPK